MDQAEQPQAAGPSAGASEAGAASGPCLRLRVQPEGPRVDFNANDVIVGRHSDCDLSLRLPDVSRRHCRFVRGNDGWHVTDLHSTNGLFVNGLRVQEAVLRHGDMVKVGSYAFMVDFLGQSNQADAAARWPILPQPAQLPLPDRLAS